jgi:transposase
MIVAERAARRRTEALVTAATLEIERLRLLLAKARRERFGQTSERAQRLVDQLELQLAELEESLAEDEAKGDPAADPVSAHLRRKPARRPLPEHLPRERVVIPPPETCRCCGGRRLARIGEVITETLDVVPRRWFVRQTVRETFTCRDCEAISEPPAPFHVVPRGRFGAGLLAMVLFEKYGCHQPLNRQSERYAREGVNLDVSTLADQVGTAATVLAPLHALLRHHVLAAGRLHGDDTTVPVLAKGRTTIGRLWTYVRDDRPFAGPDPPAALFHYSPDRRGEHPTTHLATWSGILQADAYSGLKGLYEPLRPAGPVTEALCWAHARRNFFELADLGRTRRGPPSPLALEAVRRIDAILDHERRINGRAASERLACRREHVAPLIGDLESWLRTERPRLSRHAEVARAMDYMLKRWPAFTGLLDDGRICATNNAAERALRGIALGRKAWLFCGSDRGGERAAVLYSLIGTAKLNGVDPQAWLADVLERIAAHPMRDLHALLPWNWQTQAATAERAAA